MLAFINFILIQLSRLIYIIDQQDYISWNQSSLMINLLFCSAVHLMKKNCQHKYFFKGILTCYSWLTASAVEFLLVQRKFNDKIAWEK